MFYFKSTLVLAVGLVLLFSVCPSAYADVYRYKDEKGVWHFSNMRSNSHYRLYRSSSSKRSAKKHISHKSAKKHIPYKNVEKYNDYILLASKLFSVEQTLIKAIIKAESNFDCRAVSSKGAQGLMQLMPGTVDEMEVKDPFDPKENIVGGTKYVSLLLKRFKNDKTLALAAYNAGPTVVASRNEIPPFPETRTFVKRVMRYYQTYNGGAE